MFPVRPKTLPFPPAALSGSDKPAILARQDRPAPPRVSIAIPISTAVSVLTLTAVIAKLEKL